MTNNEKNTLALATGLVLMYFINRSNKKISGNYKLPEEVVVGAMIGQTHEFIEFPHNKMTAKQRKELLQKTLNYNQSSVNLTFKYNKEKGKLPKITSSRMVLDYLKQVYPPGNLDAQEMFVVLYLNQANAIIGHDIISFGGVSATVADARLIIQKAILLLSAGVILSHNHPSGNLSPSQADLSLTTKLKQAMLFIDIALLDHIIVGDMDKLEYYSFADHGKL